MTPTEQDKNPSNSTPLEQDKVLEKKFEVSLRRIC